VPTDLGFTCTARSRNTGTSCRSRSVSLRNRARGLQRFAHSTCGALRWLGRAILTVPTSRIRGPGMLLALLATARSASRATMRRWEGYVWTQRDSEANEEFVIFRDPERISKRESRARGTGRSRHRRRHFLDVPSVWPSQAAQGRAGKASGCVDLHAEPGLARLRKDEQVPDSESASCAPVVRTQSWSPSTTGERRQHKPTLVEDTELKQLRLLGLSLFVLLGATSLLSPLEASAEEIGASCGTCFGSFQDCADAPTSQCGGPATVWRCHEGHWCCSPGEWYGFCTNPE
jgi:hypothetical protein